MLKGLWEKIKRKKMISEFLKLFCAVLLHLLLFYGIDIYANFMQGAASGRFNVYSDIPINLNRVLHGSYMGYIYEIVVFPFIASLILYLANSEDTQLNFQTYLNYIFFLLSAVNVIWFLWRCIFTFPFNKVVF
jgi:hypothetical protein